ncbi:MAG: NnrS family protein [Acetobacteraceae bacterium]|nr:NnrS family protein [Acetobacteraceae bacterium]MBV8523184.1 NnrS family protein [Acetobacteraceae bacterium]MBV8589228.1 NnrS family protein [Acetobacteraceae bacterium]
MLLVSIWVAGRPAGFLLVGPSIFVPGPVPQSGALHAWTAGAIGVMTLAVMSRVSLGHTGRPLTAGALTTLIYIAIVSAAVVRVLVSLMPDPTPG